MLYKMCVVTVYLTAARHKVQDESGNENLYQCDF